MNTATIIGRAGQDAEIKYFESGCKIKTTEDSIEVKGIPH